MKLGKGIQCGRERVKEISQRRRHLSRGLNEAEEPVLCGSLENSMEMLILTGALRCHTETRVWEARAHAGCQLGGNCNNPRERC